MYPSARIPAAANWFGSTDRPISSARTDSFMTKTGFFHLEKNNNKINCLFSHFEYTSLGSDCMHTLYKKCLSFVVKNQPRVDHRTVDELWVAERVKYKLSERPYYILRYQKIADWERGGGGESGHWLRSIGIQEIFNTKLIIGRGVREAADDYVISQQSLRDFVRFLGSWVMWSRSPPSLSIRKGLGSSYPFKR